MMLECDLRDAAVMTKDCNRHQHRKIWNKPWPSNTVPLKPNEKQWRYEIHHVIKIFYLHMYCMHPCTFSTSALFVMNDEWDEWCFEFYILKCAFISIKIFSFFFIIFSLFFPGIPLLQEDSPVHWKNPEFFIIFLKNQYFTSQQSTQTQFFTPFPYNTQVHESIYIEILKRRRNINATKIIINNFSTTIITLRSNSIKI